MDQSLEQWRPITGYEGLYEVSSLGRVRSLSRVVPKCTGNNYTVKERQLRQVVKKGTGHKRVYLSKGGRLTTFYVHRLVALAFLGPNPQGMLVCHGPKGVSDNSVENLYYATPKQNMLDRDRDGTSLYGAKCSWAKLNEDDVLALRRKYSEGVSQARLALEYSVSKATVCNIVNMKVWTRL